MNSELAGLLHILSGNSTCGGDIVNHPCSLMHLKVLHTEFIARVALY